MWLGHRRWSVEHAQKEAEAFQVKLRAAYFGLWDVVEDAHLKMREALEGLTPEVVSGFLVDVNNFMIKHGLYIEREDRLLVLEYLFWTNEYLRVLSEAPRGRTVMMNLVHSLSQGEAFDDQVRMLENLRDRTTELRSRLRSRIREVVGAPTSSAWSEDHRPSEELLAKLTQLANEVASSRPAGRPLIIPVGMDELRGLDVSEPQGPRSQPTGPRDEI